MDRRKKVLEQLAKYFAKKGKILNITEYKAQDDAPIKFRNVKRIFGSWSRLEQILDNKYYDVIYAEPEKPQLIGVLAEDGGEDDE